VPAVQPANFAKALNTKSLRLDLLEKGFDPNESRDESGKWTAGGGKSTAKPDAAGKHFKSPHESETVKRHLSGESTHELHARLAAGSGKEDTFLADVLKESGRSGKPELVDAAGIDKARADGWWICHRGVGDPAHAEQFRTGDLYSGCGILGNGTYTAYERWGDRGRARKFAEGYASHPDATIMMALPPTAKIADHSKLQAMQLTALKGLDADLAAGKINEDEFKKMELIYDDIGRFAALHNYDAIRSKSDGFLVVLNRSICKVKKGTS
jgi:hypothetical protein